MYKKIVFFGFVVSTALCLSKPVVAETLQESIRQALAAHPSVAAALASKDVAVANKKEARSDLFPVISAGTTVGRIYADNSTSRGLTITRSAAYSGLWEANATITQPLYDGMETKNRIEAAQARMQSADYNVLDIKENLALRATQAHIGVLQAGATLDRTQSYFEAIEDYLSRIQLMVDEGVSDESESAQARNISLMLKSTLIDYEGQLNTALASYAEIVGGLPKSDLVKPVVVSTVLEDVESAIAYAKNNHPLLKAKEKEMEALEHEIKAEKGTLYPDLNAELSGIKRDQKEEIGGELEDARALLKLSWDFEVGGASKARTRKSQAQYAEIAAENKERLRTIEADIHRAYAEMETAEKQVDLVKERETVTSDLFEAYKTQFEGARVRLLQLMQAENQLFNSQLESIAAEYRHLMAHYTVLASIGELQDVVVSRARPDFKGNLGKGKSVERAAVYSPPVQSYVEPLKQLPIETVIEEKVEIQVQAQKIVVPEVQEEDQEAVEEYFVVEENFVVPLPRPANPMPRLLPRVRESASERIYVTTK